MIEVHALKAKACVAAGTALGVSAQSSPSASVQAAVAARAHSQAKSAGQAKGAGLAKGAAQAKGAGVLGASASRPSSSRGTAGTVLGVSSRSGTLPFTGLPLWLPFAFALGLIVAGFGVRRLARPHS